MGEQKETRESEKYDLRKKSHFLLKFSIVIELFFDRISLILQNYNYF